MDIQHIKKDFPIFETYPNLVYLDSASTSQKPFVVIQEISTFYTRFNANVHRGIYKLAEEATELYETSRKNVARFIGADNPHEIIFTGNTNESINLIAQGWARKKLKSGDIVVVSEMEHHANIVPWIRLKEEIGIELYYLPIDSDFRLDYKSLVNSDLDLSKVKIVSLTHASNVLGTINPIKKIITFFKDSGIAAKYIVDAAQSAPHFKIDVKDLGCDFLAFSSHKMFGPTGIGVLWGKKELLEETDPFFVGSHMISNVTKEKATWADVPWKFEVGTGKLEAVVGLATAIYYLKAAEATFLHTIFEHDQILGDYALKKLQELDFVEMLGPDSMKERLAIFSFNVKGIHGHDVAQILDRDNIAVRSGHHCAQPLMGVLKIPATVRASFYLYNDESDVDTLIEGLKKVKEIMKV